MVESIDMGALLLALALYLINPNFYRIQLAFMTEKI